MMHLRRREGGGDHARFPAGAATRMRKLHERVEAAFDPAGILNPGRMYEGI